MHTMAIRVGMLLVALMVSLSPASWAADADNSDSAAAEVGLGVASALCSIPYGAAKIAVAIVGGVTGALTYVLSGFDKRAADAVWYTSMEGDYVVTPDHLRGKKALRFTGNPPENTPTER